MHIYLGIQNICSQQITVNGCNNILKIHESNFEK